MRGEKLLMTCLVLFATSLQLPATVILFEKVGLPLARELDGLESVPGYADNVTGVSTGGFAGYFAMGNGWTPNVTLGFSAGNDIKTVSSWRADWDGGDDANYLLDGDSGEPYYYWYTFKTSFHGPVVSHLQNLITK